eukprot:GFUD01003665.1.p1 GENE.GFUD01003665.1~~GFUD01003665.1.p1  ORF type:complete len:516 (+),score=129.49 GFUD01003665.1:38-1585(+)
MEGSGQIYEDNFFSVDLIQAQLAVPSKAKILQIFYHKLYSVDTNTYNRTHHKQKIALPPFVLRAPEEVPLAISLIREKSEDFQHRFKLTNTHPKQYSDARLAQSILDPEVVRHILSCFTKGKLKEMEDMTKTLTNRHKNRSDTHTLDKYMAKLDSAPAKVNTPPLRLNTPPVKSEPEAVEEVKIFKKTALVESNASSTCFRLDSAASVRHVGGKLSEEELEKFKTSRKLDLKAQIRIAKIRVEDVLSYSFKVSDAGSVQKEQKQRKRKHSSSDEEYAPSGATKKVRKMEQKPLKYNGAVIAKPSKVYKKRTGDHETVEDIMAQFEPCNEFIVENDRTIDKFNCRVCEMSVVPKVNQTSKNALTAHYRKEHNMERHYQCAKCDMILPSIDVWFLERHITSTGCRAKGVGGGTKSDLISCEKCSQKFNKASSYADHYKKTHTTIFKDYYKKKVECEGCGLKFTTQNMLSLHEVYEQKLCKVPCSVCKAIIEVKLNCKLEKVFKSSGLVDSVKCKTCS